MAPYVAFTYNTAYHLSTTFSLFYLLYLREPRLPIDLALENVGEVMPANPVDYVEHVALRIKTAHRIVQESLDCTFERAKQRYDAWVKPLKFTIGISFGIFVLEDYHVSLQNGSSLQLAREG